jgi:hypothetical protein
VADEPIRERILQHCATSLAAINGTGAYHLALARITRGQPVPGDLGDLPAAWLEEGDEPISQDTNRLLTRELPLSVTVWVRSEAGDLPTLTNRALADVERAMLADPTRGGLAKATTMIGNAVTRDEAPGVLGSARVDFSIQYFTAWGNPASKG